MTDTNGERTQTIELIIRVTGEQPSPEGDGFSNHASYRWR